MASTFAIIGAGPAGLMAAETIAKAGGRVTVYDRMPTPARKFLIAGRGGLNLTHSELPDLFLSRYGTAADWLKPAIRAFTPNDLATWCNSLGVETFIGSSGRVFPRSMKAVGLLRAWLTRLEQLGVTYLPRHRFLGFEGHDLRFANAANEAIAVKADAALLALGGASWPRLGSDGSWVETLAQSGVEIAPLKPANCGFTVPWSPHFSEKFAGQPLKPVTLIHQGITRQGEAMITEHGLEGGVVYALSAQLREAIAQTGSTILQLDLRPNMSVEALVAKLDKPRANKSFSTYLKSVGFSPLIVGLLRETLAPEQLTGMNPQHLALCIKALPVTLTAPAGIARAISTAGGVTRMSVDAHYMLRARPGIFVAGEMLDWEAPTGGYLLQGCFSTGVAAAKGMLRYCQTR